MKTILDRAERLWRIPQPSLGSLKFARRRLQARGADLIDLSSQVCLPPDVKPFLEATRAIENKVRPGAADPELLRKLKQAIARDFHSFASIKIDIEKEMVITPGIRITSSLLALSLLNPGDVAYCPDPGLPYFRTAVCLADAAPAAYHLVERNDYQVNIASITQPPPGKLKMLFLNYPHNPTGAAVDYFFYRDLLRTLRYENIFVVSDCAHHHPGDTDSFSMLQFKGSAKTALEMYSFSTTLGIPGLGFAVGHRDAVAILESLFRSVGLAPDVFKVKCAMAGLEHSREIFSWFADSMNRKREIVCEGLKELGWRIRAGRQVPFIWVRPPAWGSSLAFARRLFTKAAVLVAPGTDFGEGGEGWLRLSLCPGEDRLQEAVERISRHSKIWQRKYRPRT